MRFLTYAESADWCSKRGYPTRQRGGRLVRPEPDIQAPEFQRVEFALPTDSGQKVSLAPFLHGLLTPSPELLIWLGDWAVWPSSQHMPLFSRFRQALGEHRPLIEAPGHLVTPDEIEDAVSILTVSLLFFWNCHLLTASVATLSLCHTMSSAGSPAGMLPWQTRCGSSSQRGWAKTLRATQSDGLTSGQLGDSLPPGTGRSIAMGFWGWRQGGGTTRYVFAALVPLALQLSGDLRRAR
jgi:hypothetical protein